MKRFLSLVLMAIMAMTVIPAHSLPALPKALEKEVRIAGIKSPSSLQAVKASALNKNADRSDAVIFQRGFTDARGIEWNIELVKQPELICEILIFDDGTGDTFQYSFEQLPYYWVSCYITGVRNGETYYYLPYHLCWPSNYIWKQVFEYEGELDSYGNIPYDDRDYSIADPVELLNDVNNYGNKFVASSAIGAMANSSYTGWEYFSMLANDILDIDGIFAGQKGYDSPNDPNTSSFIDPVSYDNATGELVANCGFYYLTENDVRRTTMLNYSGECPLTDFYQPTPDPEPEYPKAGIYMIGQNVNGHNWEEAVEDSEFVKISDGVFRWKGDILATGFKINNGYWDYSTLNIGGNWDTGEYSATVGEKFYYFDSGSSCNIELNCDYLSNPVVVLNMNEGWLTVNGDVNNYPKPEDLDLFIVSNSVNGKEWVLGAEDARFSYKGNGIYEWNGEVLGSAFKISDDSYIHEYGSNGSDLYLGEEYWYVYASHTEDICVANGKWIEKPHVVLDTYSGSITVTGTYIDPVVTVNPIDVNMYVIGSNVNGHTWELAQDDCLMTQTSPGVFEWSGSTLYTGFKFNCGNWDTPEFDYGSTSGEPLILGETYNIANAANGYGISNIPLECEYLTNPKVILNLNNNTVVVYGEKVSQEMELFVAGSDVNGIPWTPGADGSALTATAPGVYEWYGETISGEFKITDRYWAVQFASNGSVLQLGEKYYYVYGATDNIIIPDYATVSKPHIVLNTNEGWLMLTSGDDPVPPVLPDDVAYTGLANDADGWSFVNEYLSPELDYVWSWKESYNYLNGSGYKSGNYAAVAYAVSPIIDLTESTAAAVAFDHTAKFQTNLTKDCKLLVRIAGSSEWTELDIPVWPEAGSWTFVNSGKMNISQFCGNLVEFAFKYVSTNTNADTWEISNFTVYSDAASVVVPEPVNEMIYIIGNNVNDHAWELASEDCLMTQTSPGVFEWRGSILYSGFKFNNGDWDVELYNIGTDRANDFVVPGEPYKVYAGHDSGNIPLDCDYIQNPRVVLDLNNMSVTVYGSMTDEDKEFYVVGTNVNGYNWVTGVPGTVMTKTSEGVYEWHGDVLGNEFKISDVYWVDQYASNGYDLVLGENYNYIHDKTGNGAIILIADVDEIKNPHVILNTNEGWMKVTGDAPVNPVDPDKVSLEININNGCAFRMATENKGIYIDFDILPDEYWTISSYIINGIDRDCPDDWRRATFKLYENIVVDIEVAYSGTLEFIDSTSGVANLGSDVKVCVTDEGVEIEGLSIGQQIVVYTLAGQIAGNYTASGSKLAIALEHNAQFIVRVADKAVKVIR